MPAAADRGGEPVYRELSPHPALARHVECYWSLSLTLGADEVERGTVLPDGCMDILFNLSGRSSRADGGPTAPSVVGTMTRPLGVAYRGTVDLIGVRFRPGGARPYVEADASELTDRVAPLEDLWGGCAYQVHERLLEVDGLTERASVLDSVLLERLRSTSVHPDDTVLTASEIVAARSGAVSVQRLADATGLGKRQLERRFLMTVGTAPKVAARVARFRSAAAALHANPAARLSRIAIECGYADQAHFTREFKALAGTTPGAYRADIQ